MVLQNIDAQKTTKETTLCKYMNLSTFSICYSQDSCFDLCAESQYQGCNAVQNDPCDSIHFCTTEGLACNTKKLFQSI